MFTQNEALEFIVAYYSAMAYHQADLPKFYDDSALVSRPSFQEPKLISEVQNQLAFLVNKGSSINIISKSILPSNDYLAISVIGSVSINGKENIFTQMFVLQEKYDRIYITSDSIQLVESFKPENNFIVNKKADSEIVYHNATNKSMNNDQNLTKNRENGSQIIKVNNSQGSNKYNAEEQGNE